MATIYTAIQLQDRVTPVISNMVTALNHVVSSFENVERASGRTVNLASLNTARESLAQVDIAIEGIRNDISQADQAQRSLNRDFSGGVSPAAGLLNKIKGIAGVYLGLQGIKKTIGFFSGSVQAENTQIEAETKLTTIMRQRMGATDSMVQSVKNLTAAQQKIGVVGDEVQMAGAQQLATFLNSDKSLKTLIPAMNNLAVQQNGVDVTAQNVVSIGNMMGKAMQGQTTTLARVGITFNDAQEKALKYGNEEQRAAVLAQVITDNVGNMNQVMAQTPAGAIKQISNAWGDIRETVGGKVYPAVLQFFNTISANMGTAKQVILQLAGAFSFITYAISGIINISATAAKFISDNWSIIGPVILTVVTILGLYKAAVLANIIVEGISKAVKIASTLASVAHGAAITEETLKTTGMTKAQMIFNQTLLACPITWIIVSIIAVIAAIYIVIAIINKVKGTSISATGVICGVIATAGAFILNIAAGVVNAMIQVIWTFIEPFISIIEFVLNAANGGFNSFGDAVKNLIGQIISWFLSLGKVVTTIIDAIFKTNWTAGLSALQSNVLKWGKNKNAITIDRRAPVLFKGVSYSKAYKAGNNFGKGIEDKAKGLFGKNNFVIPEMPAMPNMPDIPNLGVNGGSDAGTNYAAQTAANTGSMASSMKTDDDNMKYLRKMAERDIVMRYVTPTINVDMSGMNNTVKNGMDIDGVVDHLARKTSEAMAVMAEG
ncbi:MAG: hypothetical protein LKJ75_02575 [Clostridia bacterium]|jgi:hypothetical protein|nr:hypothetical protein [Clostridia bacterium]MCI2014069.1 hypothetical protein [Clostridia bacterium]